MELITGGIDEQKGIEPTSSHVLYGKWNALQFNSNHNETKLFPPRKLLHEKSALIYSSTIGDSKSKVQTHYCRPSWLFETELKNSK